MKKTKGLTIDDEAEVDTATLARLIGMTPHAVSKAADARRLVRGRMPGHYKLRDSVQRYVEVLRSGPKGGGKGYEAAKTREKEAKARLAEMEADEKEGKLIDVDTISATMGSVLTAFTARLSNFGDGLASICHNQPGDFVAGRVNDGLRAMLKEISRMPHVPKPK